MKALVDDLLAAHAHHLAGHPAAAEAACRGVLRGQPDEPAALHLLGRLAWDAGRLAEALGIFRRAAALAPDVPDFHNSLGAALARSGGDPAAALAAFGRALALRPGYVEAHRNRGLCL